MSTTLNLNMLLRGSLAGVFMAVASPVHAAVVIDSATVTVSRDGAGLATAPYTVTFLLSHSADVTIAISDSLGDPVKTILKNAFRADLTVSTNTATWDGLTAQGSPAPVGGYTATITATDPSDGTTASPVSITIPVESLAGDVINYKSIFENATFVYPNPVRNGSGTFQYEAVRDGAILTLKIYTIDGTLVRSETFPGLTPGVPNSFVWDTTNQSGRKVGRGLYYYVVREQDPAGTLQVVKKLVVVP